MRIWANLDICQWSTSYRDRESIFDKKVKEVNITNTMQVIANTLQESTFVRKKLTRISSWLTS